MKKVIKHIPGFRSNKLWKKVIASSFYFFVFLIILAIFIPTGPIVTLSSQVEVSEPLAKIQGKSEAEAPIKLLKENDVIYEGLVSSDGNFSLDIEGLQEGFNEYQIEVCKPKDINLCTRKSITVVYELPVQEISPALESEKIIPTPTTSQNNNSNEIEQQQGDLVTIVRVIDGDTVEIEGGKRVRYIGIDTPETVHPNQAVQCFGKEASNKNKSLVEGKKVKLVKDVSETDRYGRLLRYVYIGDIFVNDYLVRQGYANSSSYPPDVKFQEQFRNAEREARENNRGLWGQCSDGATSTVQQQSAQTIRQQSDQTIQQNTQGVVKKSTNNICHAPGTTYYSRTLNFTSYNTLDECLSSGGRMPLR